MNTRQDEVKPNAAWYSTTPAKAPTMNNAAWRQLTMAFRYHAASTIAIAVIAAGPGTIAREAIAAGADGLRACVFMGGL
jgi:hypothetical protein